MFRISVVALATTALLASAPGIAAARSTVRSAPSCAGAWTVATDEPSREQAVSAVLCMVNWERTTHGLSALRASTPLAAAAAGHSSEMVAGKFMSHASPGGGNLRTRALKTGYLSSLTCSTLLGETIAFGSGSWATPAHLVSSFMQDPAHRRTMLDRRYRDAGVGLALGAPMAGSSGSAATVTVDFGRR
jgi:uncharacterized protein YkwD